MKESLTITRNSNYVTSSRAAQLSGYSQDYVGQLCREASIACKRVSGEWQVDIAALLAYKKRFNPNTSLSTNTKTEDNVDIDTYEDNSIIDGDDAYISSQTAAKRTGYSQDYIGQLARSGSVKAKKVGRKWFVDEASLIEHKNHNDTLLAAVQAEAAGVAYPNAVSTHSLDSIEVSKDQSTHSIPIVTYKRDDGSLVPSSRGDAATALQEPHVPEVKIMSNIQNDEVQFIRKDLRNTQKDPRKSARYSPNNRDISPILTDAAEEVDTHSKSIKASIFSRIFFALILISSITTMGMSILLPDASQRFVASVANTLGISPAHSRIKEVYIIKEVLQAFSTVIEYKKDK